MKLMLLLLPLWMNLAAAQYPWEIAYKIGEKDLIPEGITHSAATGSFYLSSINKTKIVRIDARTGEYRDFISSDVLGMKVLGLFADDERGFLWACAAGSPSDPYRAAVAKFDLHSGKLIRSYERNDAVLYTINDLTLDGKGNVYYTNRAMNSILRIDLLSGRVELFFQGEEIGHPNGIAISPDDRLLYVASEDRGIRMIDTGRRQLLPADDGIDSKGLDGLKFYKDSLIGIQNEVKNSSEVNISRYHLDKNRMRIVKREVIDRGNPEFDIPTTFVIVGDDLYCIANSQLGNYSRQGIKDPGRLQDVKIIRYSLRPTEK